MARLVGKVKYGIIALFRLGSHTAPRGGQAALHK